MPDIARRTRLHRAASRRVPVAAALVALLVAGCAPSARPGREVPPAGPR